MGIVISLPSQGAMHPEMEFDLLDFQSFDIFRKEAARRYGLLIHRDQWIDIQHQFQRQVIQHKESNR